MKHLFVPYEIALELKNKGFDESCFGNYDGDEHNLFINCLNSHYDIPAPLYQQCVDWFRKKHNLSINITLKEKELYYYIEIWRIYNFAPFHILKYACGKDWSTGYKDYYEALNKAIKEALKLIS